MPNLTTAEGRRRRVDGGVAGTPATVRQAGAVPDDRPLAWTVRRVRETGSTNADLVAEAGRGAAEGRVLVADSQTAGRGRLGRHWVTPPGSALAVSALLRPPAAARDRLGWLPLLSGLAVLDAVGQLAPGLVLALKWPNDVLVHDPAGVAGKVSGVLVQAAPHHGQVAGADPAVVVGIGVNVATPADQLPAGAGATSLLAAGATVDRDALLDDLLGQLARRYRAWVAGVDPVADYRARCSTLRREVVVDRPVGVLTGRAVDVDEAGRLLVQPPGGAPVAVDAGDVTHLRTAADPSRDGDDRVRGARSGLSAGPAGRS